MGDSAGGTGCVARYIRHSHAWPRPPRVFEVSAVVVSDVGGRLGVSVAVRSAIVKRGFSWFGTSGCSGGGSCCKRAWGTLLYSVGRHKSLQEFKQPNIWAYHRKKKQMKLGTRPRRVKPMRQPGMRASDPKYRELTQLKVPHHLSQAMRP